MKTSWKTIGTLIVGMAFILGIQQVPFHEILNAQAQTTRMLAGPHDIPFKAAYLTPTSNTLNPNLPAYALPAIGLVGTTGINYPAVMIDLNADGLLDFAYSAYTSNYAEQFVILNTGNGFNLAYVCQRETVYTGGAYVHTYKGDCAAQ